MYTEKANRWQKILSATLLIGAGLVLVGQVPAFADPPDRARHHDENRRDDNRRDDKRGRDERNRWEKENRNRDNRRDHWDRPRSNWNTSWEYRDSDGDGVRNRWDRYPNNPRRH